MQPNQLSPGQIKLYGLQFNRMNQEWQEDGTVIVTLSSGNDDAVTVMHIQDFQGPKETILSEESTIAAVPDHLKSRALEARTSILAQQQAAAASASAGTTPSASISPSISPASTG